MAINRFQQQANPARFSPLTFEEQGFAPLALRQREDALMNTKDALLKELHNIEVTDNYSDMLNQKRQDLENKIGYLSELITKDGAGNLNHIAELRKLRNDYNKQVSANGSIGKAVQAKTNVDTMEVAYLEDAVNTKGHDTKTALEHFEKEKQDYLDSLPKDLDKHQGSLPNFVPNFAPKNVDFVDEAFKIADKATGLIKEFTGKFAFEPDGKGGLIIVNTGKEDVRNEEALKSFKKLMEEILLDPNSDLNKAMAYKKIDPKEYINSIGHIMGMKLIKTDSKTEQYAGGIAGDTDEEETDPPTPPGDAAFQNVSNGKRLISSTVDSVTIEEKKKELETNPPEGKSEDEIQSEITLYNHVLQQKMELEKDPNFKERINSEIQNNSYFSNLGIETYDEYLDFTKNSEANLARRTINTMYNQFLENAEGSANEYLPLFTKVLNLNDEALIDVFENPEETLLSTDAKQIRDLDIIDKWKSNLIRYEKKRKDLQSSYNIISNELLEPSSSYILSSSGDDKKFVEELNSTVAQTLDIPALMNNGAFRLAGPDGMFRLTEFGEPLDTFTGSSVKEGNYNSNLKDMVGNASKSDIKWNLRMIHDGGLSKPAELIFDLDVKNGSDKFKVGASLILDPEKNKALTEQFLNPNGQYYKLLNAEGRGIMDGIRDKNEYGGVATDLRMQVDKGFDPWDDKGTASIKRKSQKALSKEYNINIKDSNDILADWVYVNPLSDDDYSAQINDDDSYSMYKKSQDGEESVMTFNDYARKIAASEAAIDNKVNDLEEDPEAWEDWGKANVLINLMNIASDFESTAGLNMYSTNDKFLEGLRKYNSIWQRLSKKEKEKPTDQMLKQAATIFDTYIGSLDVRSRLLKNIL